MKQYVATFSLIFILFGCTSIEKATQKVLTNKEAFETVGWKYSQLNPCINDTIAYFIQGDTTVNEVHDTLVIKAKDTFTVKRIDTVKVRTTRTVRITDTIKQVVTDVREITYLTAKLSEQSGKLIQLSEGKAKAEKNSRSYLIALIVSLLLNLAFLILLFKRK